MLEIYRQNIAGSCQQTLCFQQFVDNTQQCFAFTPQANFESRIPFKIYSTLAIFLIVYVSFQNREEKIDFERVSVEIDLTFSIEK